MGSEGSEWHRTTAHSGRVSTDDDAFLAMSHYLQAQHPPPPPEGMEDNYIHLPRDTPQQTLGSSPR